MDTLPPELWLEILGYFNCQELNTLKLMSINTSDLITKNDLFDKRKMRGFPRSEGYCVLHDTFKVDDLVRGDIIGQDSIFDGNIVILMKSVYDNHFELPNEFTIINNNVPIEYWARISRKYWIDIKPFREQCLKNIKCEEYPGMYIIHYCIVTNFEYNGKNHKLTYMSYSNKPKEALYKKLEYILTKGDKLYVEWDDIGGEFSIDSSV